MRISDWSSDVCSSDLRGLRAPGQERRQPMKTRTSEKTVTFRKPFALAGLDEVMPAGIYSVETAEELVEGISYPAYRRTATVLRIHAASGPSHLTRALAVEPEELKTSLARDALSRVGIPVTSVSCASHNSSRPSQR